MRIGLAAYLASFAVFFGLVILIVLNLVDAIDVQLPVWPFVLAVILMLSGKLTMAQATKASGIKTNG